MSDNFYDDLDDELKAANHNPTAKAQLVAIVQAKALVDIARSLAIISEPDVAPVQQPAPEELAEPEHQWRIGDRGDWIGGRGVQLVDAIRVEQGVTALRLIADEGDADPGWVYARDVEYVDHPVDERHDEDGDLQGTEPADDLDHWPEGDLVVTPSSTEALAKLRAASKPKKPKKA